MNSAPSTSWAVALAGSAAFAALGQTPPPASQPAQACYVGPIEVLVEDPDGKPASGASVGVFGATWYSKDGQDPPPRFKPHRTDEQGRFSLKSVTECMWPTFYYAFDESRELAGFRLVKLLSDLANPHTVKLEPARWVTGRIVSSELKQRGWQPDLAWAKLSPIEDARLRSRFLRYVPSKSARFRFLVPPGKYWLDVGARRAVVRQGVEVRVPSGSGPLDLGTFDLPMSKLARLVGQPAPEWDVLEWSDGRTRTLATLRGRPILLCFWHKQSGPRVALRRLTELHARVKGRDIAMVTIHPPESGGLAKIYDFMRKFERDPNESVAFDGDPRRWPIPTGLDRACPDAISEWGFQYGCSRARYGKVVSPLFVLIDRAGRIVANTQTHPDEFERELAKLTESP